VRVRIEDCEHVDAHGLQHTDEVDLPEQRPPTLDAGARSDARDGGRVQTQAADRADRFGGVHLASLPETLYRAQSLLQRVPDLDPAAAVVNVGRP